MALLITSGIALLAAWAVVGLVTSELPRRPQRLVLQAGLTLAAWLGIESCLSFVWLVLRANVGTPVLEVHDVAVGGLDDSFLAAKTISLLVVAFVAAVAQRRQTAQNRSDFESPTSRVRPALVVAFSIVLAVAVVGFVYAALAEPYGGDDALSIWNLHARFLYFGGMDWERPFIAARSQGIPAAWHLDYPLGLPMIVACGWAGWGQADPWLGGCVAGLFTLATVLVTVGGVAALRGINQGLLAGAALLGAVGYIQIGARQYADIPLSMYFAAALICLVMGQRLTPGSARWLVLCGWFTGLAAWTKNEGLLFALSAGVVASWMAFRTQGPRGMLRLLGTLLIGAAPAMLCLAWFKWTLAPGNDLFVEQSSTNRWARITDPHRYWQIARAMVDHYFNLGKVIAIAAPLYWLGAGASPDPVVRRARTLIGATLMMMLCGYFAVYLITPRDLAWHLSSSMTRLAAQLWPSLILLIFLASRSVDETTALESAPGKAA
jgi:hypothetical protein